MDFDRLAIWHQLPGLITTALGGPLILFKELSGFCVFKRHQNQRTAGSLPVIWLLKFVSQLGFRCEGFTKWELLTDGVRTYISGLKTSKELTCLKEPQNTANLGMKWQSTTHI